MSIFMSYAREDFALAEKIAQGLRNSGHTVFFDKHDMVSGEDFDARIRDHIASADRFVFLISHNSLDAGSYTLTELKFARERWPAAREAVLPVIIDKTVDLKTVPTYLTSVHVFQPEGNIPAETANEIDKGATVNGFCKSCAAVVGALVLGISAFGAQQALIPVLWPVDVAVLPFEKLHFRPRMQPPADPSVPGAQTSWTKSPATVTLMNVSYAHRTDRGKRARVLGESIELQLGERTLKADWTYFVDLRTTPPCPDDWLCVKTNAGPETIEPGKTTAPRETMFLFPDNGTIIWGDLIDLLLTSDNLPVKLTLRARIEVPEGAVTRMETSEVVCVVDGAVAKQGLTKYYKPGQDPRPIFWQPDCEK